MEDQENTENLGDENVVLQLSWIDWLSDIFYWFMYKTIKFVPF